MPGCLSASLACLLVGYSCRSSWSSSRIVQDVWEVYRGVLGVVPDEVVRAVRVAASRSAVDDFWTIWEVRVLRLVCFGLILLLEVLLLLATLPFLGRGFLRIRSRRLGGKAVGGRSSSRLYRVSQGDEVDNNCAQFFVNSSLSPVLLFRRRLKSVADVLKSIRSKGFTQSRWDALVRYWGSCMSSWSMRSHFFSSSLG